MSTDNSQAEQVYLRDDLHELASQTQSFNFNVRQYRHSRNSKPNNNISTKTWGRVHTEPLETEYTRMKSLTTEGDNFDRIMVKREPSFKKRAGLTGPFPLKRPKEKSLSKFNQSILTEDEIKEHRQGVEKSSHKGPLRKKIIETWLNTILMESSHVELMDATVANAALKKFEIDENSLLSRGIKPETIERIYRSLFVHSIGFNNNLKEMVGGRIEALKNIWKVYSNLLEYCAEGKFETLVGIIEREKITKIDELREEISRRQHIIEKNDELNENKNIEIFKQIKHLKAENINLNNEKEILYEDYQKTEQAFNEEVALRLKFENKINELFGVHRELGIKHQRLYDDFKKKLLEFQNISEKNAHLTTANWELKMQVNDLTMEKEKLEKSVKYNSEYIMALKDEKMKLKENCNMYKHEYDEERRMNKELQRRLTQYEIETKNLTEIVAIKDRSWKETHSEYQLSLEENNRLYQIISEQRLQVEELLFDKKEFNNKIMSLVADASFEKKKKEEYSALYYETDRKLAYTMDKLSESGLDAQIKSTRIASLEEDLNCHLENIKKMHQANSELEEQLLYLRRYKQNLGPLVQEKETQMEELAQKSDAIQKEFEETKRCFNILEGQYKTMKGQLENEIEILKHRIDKLNAEREELENSGNVKGNQILMARKEIEKYTKLFQEAMTNFKNEKFERVNLKANYDQSLNIIEKKNAAEKALSIQVSELKDSISSITNEKHKLSLALENEALRKLKLQELNEEAMVKIGALREKCALSVHVAVFEDLAENYRILKGRLEASLQVCREKSAQIEQIKQSYQNKIEAIHQTNLEYQRSLKEEKDKQLFQKQSQLEYEKDKNERMTDRLKELEGLAQTYAKKIEERTTSERQKIYKSIIEEKSLSIKELLKKNEMVVTECEQIKEKLIKNEEHFTNQLSSLKKEHREEQKKFQEKIFDLDFEINYSKKQNQRLKAELQEVEGSLEEKVKERLKYLQLEGETKRLASRGDRTQSISEDSDEKEKLEGKLRSKWKKMKKLEDMDPELKKRNDISRKMKLAYTYYKS